MTDDEKAMRERAREWLQVHAWSLRDHGDPGLGASRVEAEDYMIRFAASEIARLKPSLPAEPPTSFADPRFQRPAPPPFVTETDPPAAWHVNPPALAEERAHADAAAELIQMAMAVETLDGELWRKLCAFCERFDGHERNCAGAAWLKAREERRRG